MRRFDAKDDRSPCLCRRAIPCRWLTRFLANVKRLLATSQLRRSFDAGRSSAPRLSARYVLQRQPADPETACKGGFRPRRETDRVLARSRFHEASVVSVAEHKTRHR